MSEFVKNLFQNKHSTTYHPVKSRTSFKEDISHKRLPVEKEIHFQCKWECRIRVPEGSNPEQIEQVRKVIVSKLQRDIFGSMYGSVMGLKHALRAGDDIEADYFMNEILDECGLA